jgi:TolB-like protein/DNA-binding winged helix-turn-helix (wHTH) protein
MDRPVATPVRVGAWCVDPMAGQISRGQETVRVEARTLRLLMCFAEHAGEVLSIDELLDQVWPKVVVTPDSVYQAITSLRRLLGDDPRQPTYIATVPRLGYRMIAPVSPWTDQPNASPNVAPTSTGASPARTILDARPAQASRLLPWWVIGALVCIALTAALLIYNRPTAPATTPQKSVAVLPFLDLTTQAMDEEYFADGMTEELIDKLSKIPGLRVPAPTASFYFKGKKKTVTEIAKALGVTYVIDGSVRKSDATMRIAARLVRADDGYVVWSETYDRPADDKLKVQDDIASEVAQALTASIN